MSEEKVNSYGRSIEPDHAEAYQLALMRQPHSNLAHCYIVMKDLLDQQSSRINDLESALAQQTRRADVLYVEKANAVLAYEKKRDRIAELESRLREVEEAEVVGWLYWNEEGDDAFSNNWQFVKDECYRGEAPLPLIAKPSAAPGAGTVGEG